MGISTLLLCLCVIIAALVSSNKKDTLHIATKPMSEQYVLGEMLDLLIEQDTDLNVELTQGVGGGTSNIQPAMESGEFDIYSEYTGTGWNMVLKKRVYIAKIYLKQCKMNIKIRFKCSGLVCMASITLTLWLCVVKLHKIQHQNLFGSKSCIQPAYIRCRI